MVISRYRLVVVSNDFIAGIVDRLAKAIVHGTDAEILAMRCVAEVETFCFMAVQEMHRVSSARYGNRLQ